MGVFMNTALITGASSGIGMEFARQLCIRKKADGFILVARREERLSALREELLSLGASAVTVVEADLLTDEGIDAVSRTLKEKDITLSYYVGAAGFGVFGDCMQLPEDTVSDMIDLNVRALVLLTNRAIAYMREGCRMILLGSASCFTPLPGFNIYAASKAFVMHYARALRYELRERRIFVTCFCPGWVDTEFLGKAEKPGVRTPKSYKPLLKTENVVRGCIRAADKKKMLYVTNWYTKTQHLLSKIAPTALLISLWRSMLKKG